MPFPELAHLDRLVVYQKLGMNEGARFQLYEHEARRAGAQRAAHAENEDTLRTEGTRLR